MGTQAQQGRRRWRQSTLHIDHPLWGLDGRQQGSVLPMTRHPTALHQHTRGRIELQRCKHIKSSLSVHHPVFKVYRVLGQPLAVYNDALVCLLEQRRVSKQLQVVELRCGLLRHDGVVAGLLFICTRQLPKPQTHRDRNTHQHGKRHPGESTGAR